MSRSYDAGLLPEGNHDQGWWQTAMRNELDRAHEFYSADIDALQEHNAQLRAALKQALRQWSMYAEFEEIDLTDEKSPEAEMYRAAKAALKLGEDNG